MLLLLKSCLPRLICTLLVVFLQAAPFSGSAQTFSAGQPNIFYSPWDWNISSRGTAVTNQPGAYFQFTFRGSRSVTLNMDLTGIAPLDSSNYMFVQWSIDGVLQPDYQITPQSAQIVLGSKLDINPHTVRFSFASAEVFHDRWSASALLADGSLAPAQSLRITGITLDPGAGLTPTSGLQPRHIVFYGDSITEGFLIDPFNDATLTYAVTCAKQLHAEFGVIANSGQGWTLNNALANRVPPFAESWRYYYANAPRFPLAPGADRPDYILANFGANDALNAEDGLSLGRRSLATKLAVEYLNGIRTFNPTSKIFLVAPFGGFYEQATHDAVFQYRQAHPQDHGVYLIDLGWSAWVGINGTKRATPQSYDGVHPNLATSQALGFQLAAALQTTLGQYDFLGTGNSNLILQNSATGKIAFRAATSQPTGPDASVAPLPPPGYQVVGAGDFDGDGKPDLVLQNPTTGGVIVWYMNGTTVLRSSTIALKTLPGWKVVGIADMDSDGKPDLVLQNAATGAVLVWFMSGDAVRNQAFVSEIPPAGYQVVGVADFNRDGKPDLVLQNAAAGQVGIWYLDGLHVVSKGLLPVNVSTGYHVESVADYSGDGRPSLVFRDSNGNLLTSQTTDTFSPGVFAAPRLDPAWRIVGPR